MSSAVTATPSSRRRRFSSRIFSENGSFATDGNFFSSVGRLKIVFPSSVVLVPNELLMRALYHISWVDQWCTTVRDQNESTRRPRTPPFHEELDRRRNCISKGDSFFDHPWTRFPDFDFRTRTSRTTSRRRLRAAALGPTSTISIRFETRVVVKDKPGQDFFEHVPTEVLPRKIRAAKANANVDDVVEELRAAAAGRSSKVRELISKICSTSCPTRTTRRKST